MHDSTRVAIHPVMLRTTVSQLLGVFLLLTHFAKGSSNCAIDVTDQAVVSGGSVSLRCTSAEPFVITAWRSSGDRNKSIYNSTFYDLSTNHVIPASTADGFFVDDSSSYQSILYINHTNLSYAGTYYCKCSENAAGGNTEEVSSNIVVLDASNCAIDVIDKAVVSGDSVSLRCTSKEPFVITAWRFSGDRNKSIHNTSYYDPYKNELIPAFTADGFFVDDSVSYRHILYMNHTNLSYAGMYYCKCSDIRLGGSTEEVLSNIVVIDSEPQFSGSDSLAGDDPVELICGISYRGKANSSIQILNMTGNVIAHCQQTTSSDCAFNGTSGAGVDKAYFCIVSLSNSSGYVIYSKTINKAVYFSVRNVSIVPEDFTRCLNNGYCVKNILHCNADGNPDPSIHWTTYINGQKFVTSAIEYNTTYAGEQIIQCTASNFVGNRMWYASVNFTTNVLSDAYRTPTPPFLNVVGLSESSTSGVGLGVGFGFGLGVGLGVGFGLILIILAVIVIFIFYSRKKKHGRDRNLWCSGYENFSDPQRDIYTEQNPQH